MPDAGTELEDPGEVTRSFRTGLELLLNSIRNFLICNLHALLNAAHDCRLLGPDKDK